jgi:hypothetical protein
MIIIAAPAAASAQRTVGAISVIRRTQAHVVGVKFMTFYRGAKLNDCNSSLLAKRRLEK